MNTIATGNYICEKREAMGWTQEKLASMVGVSTKTISSWENGKSKIQHENMMKLADALGVSVVDIMEGKDITGLNEKEKQIIDEQIKELMKQVNDLNKITIRIESGGAEAMELATIAAVVAYIALSLAVYANNPDSLVHNALIVLCFIVGTAILWIGKKKVKQILEDIQKREGK